MVVVSFTRSRERSGLSNFGLYWLLIPMHIASLLARWKSGRSGRRAIKATSLLARKMHRLVCPCCCRRRVTQIHHTKANDFHFISSIQLHRHHLSSPQHPLPPLPHLFHCYRPSLLPPHHLFHCHCCLFIALSTVWSRACARSLPLQLLAHGPIKRSAYHLTHYSLDGVSSECSRA